MFHNLSGYDAHLFIKELARKYGKEGMNVIAENSEKYISFSLNIEVGTYVNKKGETVVKKIQLRFIDSFRFMASSLDKLSANLVGVSNLLCDDKECASDCSLENIDENYVTHGKCPKCDVGCMRQLDKDSLIKNFKSMYTGDDEQFRLMLRKGIYPYEYVDSFDRFNEGELPPKDEFL